VGNEIIGFEQGCEVGAYGNTPFCDCNKTRKMTIALGFARGDAE